MNDYAFGEFIYTLRKEKGISQAQLGAMLGVTNKAVSKWETGTAKPNTSLLPRIAEILGVTVEELLAAKRIEHENDEELLRLKDYLFALKYKYAVLTSVFFAIGMCLPFLLIEFICVVMGFGLPDDVAGPLGSVLFFLGMIICWVLFFVYSKAFKSSFCPDGMTCSSAIVVRVKKGVLISGILAWNLLVLTFPICFLYVDLSGNITASIVVLLIFVFFTIMSLGSLLGFWMAKRMLRIRFTEPRNKGENRRRSFSELSALAKLCNIAATVLLPISLSLLIYGRSDDSMHFIKYSVLLIFHICVVVSVLESRK